MWLQEGNKDYATAYEAEPAGSHCRRAGGDGRGPLASAHADVFAPCTRKSRGRLGLQVEFDMTIRTDDHNRYVYQHKSTRHRTMSGEQLASEACVQKGSAEYKSIKTGVLVRMSACAVEVQCLESNTNNSSRVYHNKPDSIYASHWPTFPEWTVSQWIGP